MGPQYLPEKYEGKHICVGIDPDQIINRSVDQLLVANQITKSNHLPCNISLSSAGMAARREKSSNLTAGIE